MFQLPAETFLNIPSNIIGIIITGVFGIVIGAIAAIMARRGQKLGNRESRAPDVQEMWAQQESDRRARQTVEDMLWNLRRVFQAYVRRVMSAVLSLGLTPEQAKKFDLTTKELSVINAKLPTDEE